MLWAEAPTLRCVKRNNDYFLLEGSHRIAACYHLGLTPKLVVVQEELDDSLDSFWKKLDLPCYEFKEVLELNLNA